MSLNRLEPASDLTDDAGRGQLQETLELFANRLRLQAQELELIKDADRIVRPVRVAEFPVAAGQIYTGEESGEIGDIVARAVRETPQGTLECDGAAVSRTTFSDLFAKIGVTYGIGDGFTTFNVPDLRGRTLVGFGTGDGGSPTAWFMGRKLGNEGDALTLAQLATHSHFMNHNHSFFIAGAIGSGSTYRHLGTTAFGDAPFPTFTPGSIGDILGSILGAVNSPVAGPNTGLAGLGAAHNTLQPSLGTAFFIRFRLGPSDTIQTLPISWGGVNAQWRLDTFQNFPKTDVENNDTVVVVGDLPEAVVKIKAGPGVEVGSTSDLKIIGVTRIPFNFTTWRQDAFSIRTKLDLTGVLGGESVTITLRVSDPISAGSFLSNIFTRTVVESGGVIQDTDFVDAFLTAEDLGKDWKPGYLFRFELEFTHPKTFDTSELSVGLLQLNWR